MSNSSSIFEFKASRAQRRLWFIHQLHGTSKQYNIPHVVKLTGVLDEKALSRALNDVSKRHESLRTYFRYNNEQLFQVVAEPYVHQIEREQCIKLTKDIEQAFCDKVSSTAFELTQLPLFKLYVLSNASNEHLIGFVFHHSISDGWSFDIFLRELSHYYQLHHLGNGDELPPLELQYVDYAAWHNECCESDDGPIARTLNEQVKLLREIPDLALILDKPRPKTSLYNGATESFKLNETSVIALEQVASQLSVTPFSLFMAVWQFVLSRQARQHDFAVGFPAACRTRPELEDIIGLFMNTAVVPANLDESRTVNEHITHVHNAILTALEHQDVPVDQLIDHLRPDRDLSIHPLFQVMLSYHKVADQRIDWPDLSCEHLAVGSKTSKSELTLTVEHGPQHALLTVEYSTDLFSKPTIVTLLDSFEFALNSILDNIEAPLHTIALCDDDKSSSIPPAPVECVPPELPFPHLIAAFEHNVAERADRVALVHHNVSMTYRELGHLVSSLAAKLYEVTPSKGQIIGVCMPTEPSLLVTLLAIMKTGAAYCVLDPSHPIERLAFLAEDAGIDYILHNQQTLPIADNLCRDNNLQSMLVDLAALPVVKTPVPSLCDRESHAYVIYTSGSSGHPKGVLIPQRNVMRLFSSTAHWFDFSHTDCWTLFHSTAFDFSVWEMWGALLNGGKLVLVDKNTARDSDAFYQLVIDHQVTVLNQTPSAFGQFLWVDEKYQASLPLRYIIFGGEALDFSKLASWYERHPANDIQLVNMYGITETTVHVTWLALNESLVNSGGSSLIGQPIPDLGITLIDPNGNTVPKGMVGEMVVSGPGLATGYINREALTAERFVWINDINGNSYRCYRTGDLARMTASGELAYLGRSDAQVKIRGYRIETGEIEAVITEVTGASEVAVCAVLLEASAHKQLVAYIAHTDEQIGLGRLRDLLSSRLPDYMLPSALVYLPKLPMTINGKLDVKALPEPQGLRPLLNKPFAPPVTEQERVLADVWSDVLRVSSVGIEDNFFALGGDSLRAVQVTEKARSLGVEHTLLALFEQQTIAALLKSKGNETNLFDYTETEPFSLINEQDKARLPSNIVDAYPLSAMQASMFYHMALSDTNQLYHCTGTTRFTINQPFNPVAFYTAVQNTVAAHDVYKTSFDFETFSEPLQLVHNYAELPTVIEDISYLDEQAQNKVIMTLLETEKRTPFDLSQPTLLRYFIHLRSDTSFQFTMTECHPIFDGWSYHSMIVEVFNRYMCIVDNRPYEEKNQGRFRYRDFVALEHRVSQDTEHQQFWQDQLADLTVTRLPRLMATNTEKAHQDIRVKRVTIQGELYTGVRRLCRQLEVPIKSLALAAHLKVLSIVCGEEDVLTGIPANGRPETSAGDKLAGLFLNTLPFRFSLTQNSWASLIKAVFQKETTMLRYRRYPFAHIQRDIGGAQILDEVLFNYLDFHVYDELDDALGLRAGKSLEKDQVNEGTNFALTVHFQHLTLTSNLERNQISIDIDYDTSKVTHHQAEQLQALYRTVLEEIVKSPSTEHTECRLTNALSRVSAVPVATNDFANSPSLSQQFDEVVRKYPLKTALVCGSVHINYKSLHQRVVKLATMLKSLGVTSQSQVAVLLPRSIEFIETVLAVVRLGGCYVPLDVDDPLSRKQRLITQANATLLVSVSDICFESELFGSERCPVVLLDKDIIEPSEDILIADNSVDQRAYIIFTSGSTGEPKGVEVTQRNILSLLTQQTYADFNEHSVVLHTSPTTFDAATFEIWGALLNGATLVINPNRILTNTLLETEIALYKVNTLFLTTALFNTLVDENPTSFLGLRRLLVGGEAISAKHVRMCYDHVSDISIVNMYGPTEATTFAFMQVVSPDDVAEHRGSVSVPIGRPINNVSAWVLDPQYNPVPIGTPGELYLGGGGIANGYYANQAMTSKSFVSLPHLAAQTLFKTGDKVRMLEDGRFEYLDRIDSQVKVRGFRIDLAEISSTLKVQPGVNDAYVMVQGEGADKRVVAYWSGVDSQPDITPRLRESLQKILPVYMLPNHFLKVASIPLTANGKVDRAQLLALNTIQNTSISNGRSERAIPTKSGVESDVLTVWQQVLQLDSISVDSHFFEMGGHSLLLSKVLRHLKEKGFTQLTLIDLLRYPTVRALSAYIEQGASHDGSTISEPLERRNKLADLRRKKRSRPSSESVGV